MTMPAGSPSSRVPIAADRSDGLRFGVLCVLIYVVLSWAIRIDMRLGIQMASLIYPLDTFSMYATAPPGHATRLLIRDDRGKIHHIEAFRAYDCVDPVTGPNVRCADDLGIDYIHEKLTRYIETHRGPGERQIELIARTWVITPGEAPVHDSDCVVAQCRVAP